jgi:hypothetical protein
VSARLTSLGESISIAATSHVDDPSVGVILAGDRQPRAARARTIESQSESQPVPRGA